MRTRGAKYARWVFALLACAGPMLQGSLARAVNPLVANPVGFAAGERLRMVEYRFQDSEAPEPAPRWNAAAAGSGPAVSGVPTVEQTLTEEVESPDPDALGEDDYIEPDGPHWGPFRRMLACVLPPKEGRYRDIGHPLERESWRNRPLSFSWFVGGINTDDILPRVITTGTGFFSGVRVGWDYDHFAGLETRFGGSKVALGYPSQPSLVGDANFFFWDSSWLWYPWGDTQWRPYFTVGLGMVDIKFRNQFQSVDHDTVFGMPIGFGMKYRWDNRIAFRLEYLDNIAFASGNGLSDMNNSSLTGSLEFRFGGGTRRSYWPWNPSRSWW